MFKAQVLALIPSFVIQLFVTVAFGFAVWWIVRRYRPQWQLAWELPVFVGAAFSIYTSAMAVVTLHQNHDLAAVQQGFAQASAPQAQAQVDPALRMKQDFLKTVDALAGVPDQITPDNTKKLFDSFAALFPKGDKDRETYENAILAAYSCQQFFIEDALSSMKFGKALKSDDRKHCEAQDGAFFARQTLVPPDVAKGNDDFVEHMAAHKPVAGPGGKQVEITEAMIRGDLENQIRKSQAVKRIFARAPASK
jgi:hypothetical protein